MFFINLTSKHLFYNHPLNNNQCLRIPRVVSVQRLSVVSSISITCPIMVGTNMTKWRPRAFPSGIKADPTPAPSMAFVASRSPESRVILAIETDRLMSNSYRSFELKESRMKSSFWLTNWNLNWNDELVIESQYCSILCSMCYYLSANRLRNEFVTM